VAKYDGGTELFDSQDIDSHLENPDFSSKTEEMIGSAARKKSRRFLTGLLFRSV